MTWTNRDDLMLRAEFAKLEAHSETMGPPRGEIRTAEELVEYWIKEALLWESVAIDQQSDIETLKGDRDRAEKWLLWISLAAVVLAVAVIALAARMWEG